MRAGLVAVVALLGCDRAFGLHPVLVGIDAPVPIDAPPDAPQPPMFRQLTTASGQPVAAGHSVTTLPLTNEVSAGDLLVVMVGWTQIATTVSVTDSAGDTFTQALPIFHENTGGFENFQTIFYSCGTRGAPQLSATATVTYQSGAMYTEIRFVDYAGIKPTACFDGGSSGGSLTGTQCDSGPVATTNAHDLLVATNFIVAPAVTMGPGTGYTQRTITSGFNDIIEDREAQAAGTYDATAQLDSPGGQWIMQLVAFEAVAP